MLYIYAPTDYTLVKCNISVYSKFLDLKLITEANEQMNS